MTIYRLARRMLPAGLVKAMGNRHRVKRMALDWLVWRMAPHPGERPVVREEAPVAVPRAAVEDNPHLPAVVAESFREVYERGNRRQLTEVDGPVWIEPRTGWPMTGRTLHLSLFKNGRSPYMPLPGYGAIWARGTCDRLDRAISLRDANEGGYSHLYSDLLPRLHMAEAAGIDLGTLTAVVAAGIADRPYMRLMIDRHPLMRRLAGVHRQGAPFVRAERAVFADPNRYATAEPEFHAMVETLATMIDGPLPDGPERIYLTRATTRRRSLRNDAEIAAFLAKFGYTRIDADDLGIEDQMRLFRGVRHLVALHGAGIMNMVHRSAGPMSLFHIHAPGYGAPEPGPDGTPLGKPRLGYNTLYHNVAVAMGFDYGAAVGSGFRMVEDDFEMPLAAFAPAFERFWDEHGG